MYRLTFTGQKGLKPVILEGGRQEVLETAPYAELKKQGYYACTLQQVQSLPDLAVLAKKQTRAPQRYRGEGAE